MGFDPDEEAISACGSDLISDVLRFTKTQTVLLTGLPTLHMVRTASLLDLTAVVFVRGKRPSRDVLEFAEESLVPVMCTRLPLYEACGRLYAQGLAGCSEYSDGGEERGA